MNELAIDEEGRPQRVHRLSRPCIVIGRADTVDLVLPDVSVSRRHAQLDETAEGWTVTDLSSSNGTSVNGSEASGQLLRLGDVVVIGKFTLTFRETAEGEEIADDQPEPGSWPQDENTDVKGLPSAEEIATLQQERLAQASPPPPPPPEPSPAPAAPPVREPDLAAASLVLDDGESLPIGTEPFILGRDVQLTGVLPFFTGAEIRWTGANHVIKKTGFLAQVDLNGKSIKDATLKPGDQIRIGTSRFRYEAG